MDKVQDLCEAAFFDGRFVCTGNGADVVGADEIESTWKAAAQDAGADRVKPNWVKLSKAMRAACARDGKTVTVPESSMASHTVSALPILGSLLWQRTHALLAAIPRKKRVEQSVQGKARRAR